MLLVITKSVVRNNKKTTREMVKTFLKKVNKIPQKGKQCLIQAPCMCCYLVAGLGLIARLDIYIYGKGNSIN